MENYIILVEHQHTDMWAKTKFGIEAVSDRLAYAVL